MADLIGVSIKCPACGALTAVSKDKREKLYLNCVCGLLKFNTDRGQRILRDAVDGVGEVAPEIPEKPPENSEAAVQGVLEKKDQRGLVVLGIFGVFLGGGLWILKNRVQQ